MRGDVKLKLHLPHNYYSLIFSGKDGQPGKFEQKQIVFSLFNMENDPMESTNVIGAYPDVAKQMKQLADVHKFKFYSE